MNSPERAKRCGFLRLGWSHDWTSKYWESWFFNHVKTYLKTGVHAAAPSIEERVTAARRHLQMSLDWKGEVLGVLETDDIIPITLKESPILRIRTRMVTANDSTDVFAAFDAVLEKWGGYQFA